MADVFLSYAREDLARARRLAEAIEQLGWSVWWDRKIPAGRAFADVIEEALRQARCVIVLWSKESVQSEWVREEADDAKGRRKLVPVRLDDVIPPLGFRAVHAADLIDWDGSVEAPGFRQLIEDLRALLGQRSVAVHGERVNSPGANLNLRDGRDRSRSSQEPLNGGTENAGPRTQQAITQAGTGQRRLVLNRSVVAAAALAVIVAVGGGFAYKMHADNAARDAAAKVAEELRLAEETAARKVAEDRKRAEEAAALKAEEDRKLAAEEDARKAERERQAVAEAARKKEEAIARQKEEAIARQKMLAEQARQAKEQQERADQQKKRAEAEAEEAKRRSAPEAVQRTPSPRPSGQPLKAIPFSGSLTRSLSELARANGVRQVDLTPATASPVCKTWSETSGFSVKDGYALRAACTRLVSYANESGWNPSVTPSPQDWMKFCTSASSMARDDAVRRDFMPVCLRIR